MEINRVFENIQPHSVTEGIKYIDKKRLQHWKVRREKMSDK